MSSRSLNYAIMRLSEESLSPSELVDSFSKAVPRMADYLSGVKESTTVSLSRLTGFIKSENPDESDDSSKFTLNWNNQKQAYKKGYNWVMSDAVENSEYLNMGTHGHYLVDVPENFVGNILTYSANLITSLEDTRHLYLETHGKYTALLKGFITNKADRISIKDHTALFKNLEKRQGEISKLTDPFFPDHTGKTKQKLSTVLKRAGDLEAVFDNIVKLEELNAKDNVYIIEKKVEEMTDLLGHILSDIQAGKIKDVSQATAINLASGSKAMGDLTKFYVALIYDADVLIQSVESLAETINEAFER